MTLDFESNDESNSHATKLYFVDNCILDVSYVYLVGWIMIVDSYPSLQ